MRRNTDEVFWSRVDTSGGPDACWPWTGRRKPATGGMPVGHGVYDHDGTWDYAHRYAFTLLHGPPVDLVLHRCDFPPCCNDAHLYDGTYLDNNRDRERRGRRDVRGERSPRAKLTWPQVREIRRLRSEEGLLLREIAARYEVCLSTVGYITSGRLWPDGDARETGTR